MQGILFRGAKLLDYKAGNSPPSSASVNNEWNFTSIISCFPFIILKDRDSFTFAE
jgi:hypothetical protein